SVVDRGAGEGCRVLISKRADDDDVYQTDWYKEQAAISERMNDELRAVAKARECFAANWDKHVNKSDNRDADAEPSPLMAVAPKKHREISLDLADGTRMHFPNQRALAEWTAIQARIRKSIPAQDTNTMNASEHLRDLAKRVGPIAIAKVLVDEDRSYGITEPELVAMITEYAKRDNPEMSDAMAFAKVFTDASEVGVLLRRAIQVAKNAAYEDAVDDSEAACAELAKIGAQRWPSLTKAQQFARAAETNPALLQKAHRRP